MKIYIYYTTGTKSKTTTKLTRTKLFSNIESLDDSGLKFQTKKPVYKNNTKKIAEIKKVLGSINTIIKNQTSIYPDQKFKTKKPSKVKKKNKLFRLFFDIDSTLTHTGLSTLNPNVLNTFKKFVSQNCDVYFCTGRSYQEVSELQKTYHTSHYGIAENGGIILGMGKNGRHKFGARAEPDKLISFLQDNDIEFELDPNQRDHLTEHIILKDSISEKALNAAKDASKAKVEFHTSKNTYHISEKHKNKGSAIQHLISEEEIGSNPSTHEAIGIGDSGLDIPMFKFCGKGYLIGKPTKEMKKEIKKLKLGNKIKQLKSLPPKSVEEVYKKLFPY